MSKIYTISEESVQSRIAAIRTELVTLEQLLVFLSLSGDELAPVEPPKKRGRPKGSKNGDVDSHEAAPVPGVIHPAAEIPEAEDEPNATAGAMAEKVADADDFESPSRVDPKVAITMADCEPFAKWREKMFAARGDDVADGLAKQVIRTIAGVDGAKLPKEERVKWLQAAVDQKIDWKLGKISE